MSDAGQRDAHIAPADGGPMPDGGPPLCHANSDCTDDLFCNGSELCAPGAPGADPSGCVAGAVPCPDGTCDEATDMCSSCATDADGDDDGSDAMICGGEDCDDNDATVHPGASEICNRVDDDCNGMIDDVADSLLTTWYPDRDGDGHGAGTATRSCFAPPGSVAIGDDCDDTRSSRSPGNPEIPADGVDNDCDGMIDNTGRVVHGAISTLGANNGPTVRLVAQGFEQAQSACSTTVCVTGGLTP